MAQSLKRASIAAPCGKKENHSGRLAVCHCAKEDKEKRMQHIQTLYMAMYRLNPEEQAMLQLITHFAYGTVGQICNVEKHRAYMVYSITEEKERCENDMVVSKGNVRVSKIDTYLNCAEVFAYRSTCLKRKYGAVIVKDDVVISTGYNGSPRGFENCCEIGSCQRMERNMHQGEGYGICRAVHAEMNALLNCSRQQTMNADLYLVGVNPQDNTIHRAKPCPLCARAIIQAGIRNVFLRCGDGEGDYKMIPASELDWLQKEDNL